MSRSYAYDNALQTRRCGLKYDTECIYETAELNKKYSCTCSKSTRWWDIASLSLSTHMCCTLNHINFILNCIVS